MCVYAKEKATLTFSNESEKLGVFILYICYSTPIFFG